MAKSRFMLQLIPKQVISLEVGDERTHDGKMLKPLVK